MELLVYKASAGSGKTFTLAVEYIKHLIINPRAYRQILAVTFTNKATAEMKERILTQLYGIWKGAPSSEAYLERIKNYKLKIKEEGGDRLTDGEIRQRAGMALQYMLHDYSRFRVETIDSFFQSVMRNLARELELSPNLNIELNNSEVLSDAVDSLIEKLTPTSPVLAWLLDYIDERIRDDKRWNVSNEVKSFGRNIFDESYIERGEKLRQCLRTPNTLKLYRDVLRDMETEALEQMKSFYDQFEGELEGHALTPEDLKGGARGIGSYFRKLRDGRLSDKDVLNATLQNSLADAKNWATKTSSRKDDIICLAETSLMPLLQEAERMRPQRNRTLNSCRLSLQHLNKLQLLNHIDEEVRTLNREHNRFLLSDTNALLHKLVREGDSSFVFEKIGANIRNVMIDEFQDTSRMQWDNFRLLLLEGLSQGADSLIVGDVKQSIYRWRNGDWGILNSLGNEELKMENRESSSPLNNFPVRVETLKTNRRSETNIIRFNNQVFTAAIDYLNALHLNELKEDCLPLKRAYADVVQESPKNTEYGYVKAAFLEPDDEHNYTEQTLLALGEEVQRLLEEGVTLNDITILVRKNKNIPPIADYFDKELHLSVVSDEAFRLDASLAICMLMDALRCLSNPENRIAEAALMENYKLQMTNDEQPKFTTATPLPEAFTSRRETLRLMPLYELLEELFSIFGMSRIEKQDAYLFSFFDAVTEYLQSNSSELSAFITYWEEKLGSKTIPSGEVEGIRILSIHKSKGLEYHTVLLPFCDWKMENETYNHLVWCAPRQAPFSDLDIVPINYSTAMQQSIYREEFLNERLQLWVDNLNLLYVAFTRAKKNLIIYGKAEQKGTVSELLGNALSDMTGKSYATGEEIYELGTLYLSSHEEEKQVSGNKLLTVARRLPIHLETLETNIEFKQSNRSAEFIRGEEETEDKYIRQGQLLHNLFSVIRTTDDVPPAIERLRFEGIIESAQQEEQIRKLTEWALRHPLVKEWYSGRWELYNECAIIYREKGVLQTRRPDRVMMKDGEVIVVDFKFGKKRKAYNKQVKEYMDLLSDMGYEHIRGYLWYVFNNELEEIE